MPKPYIPNDSWSRKAAKEGYRARSVYKLMELDERFELLKPGMRVLDLAAAPGSWLQYESARIGPTGLAIGIDLQEIAPIAPNVKTFVLDITDSTQVNELLMREFKEIKENKEIKETKNDTRSHSHSLSSLHSLTSSISSTFDIVLSDIAPQTSGIKDVDQWRSIELNQAVLAVAERWLKPGGRCVLKVFRGADFDRFLRNLKRDWKEVNIVTVQASRDRSREVYLIMVQR